MASIYQGRKARNICIVIRSGAKIQLFQQAKSIFHNFRVFSDKATIDLIEEEPGLC